MTAPRLLLDEDARPLLAAALQRSGFDAVHALDVGLSGAPDGEVLETAVGQRRALFTHNARDFIRLAAEYTPHRQEAQRGRCLAARRLR